MSSNVHMSANPHFMAQLNARLAEGAQKNREDQTLRSEGAAAEKTARTGMVHFERAKMAGKRARPTAITFSSGKTNNSFEAPAAPIETKKTEDTKTVHVKHEKSGTSKWAILAGLFAALAAAFLAWAKYKI